MYLNEFLNICFHKVWQLQIKAWQKLLCKIFYKFHSVYNREKNYKLVKI